MFPLIRRAFLLALCFIFLAGCSSPARQWEMQEIITTHLCFNGGRLLLVPNSDYSHLEIELVRNASGIRFYINLLFLQALPLAEDPSRTSLTLLFEDQVPCIVYPYLLEGGQRLLLPGDVADLLVQSLLDDRSFTLQIGRSQIVVTPTHFVEGYQRLLDIPIEECVPHSRLGKR